MSLSGSSTLHLRGVQITGPQFSFNVGPYTSYPNNETMPLGGAQISSTRLSEVFINVTNMAIRTGDSAASVVCGALSVDLEGTFQTLGANGLIRETTNETSFAGQVLAITGLFHLDETTRANPTPHVEATVVGDLRVIGVDFQIVAGSNLLDNVAAQVGIGLLLATAVGFVLKQAGPSIAVLYTRLAARDLKGHPVRNRILRTISKEGPMTQTRLVQLVGGSRGAVRHHVEILNRAGFVRMLAAGNQLMVAEPDTVDSAAFYALLREKDSLAAVHTAVNEGLVGGELTARVAAMRRVSARTARRYAQRYQSVAAETKGE